MHTAIHTYYITRNKTGWFSLFQNYLKYYLLVLGVFSTDVYTYLKQTTVSKTFIQCMMSFSFLVTQSDFVGRLGDVITIENVK